jgi:hypothetical protein
MKSLAGALCALLMSIQSIAAGIALPVQAKLDATIKDVVAPAGNAVLVAETLEKVS